MTLPASPGPSASRTSKANYASMAEFARAHDIRYRVCVRPSRARLHREAKESFARRPREKILALNHWLKDYCAKNGLRVPRLLLAPWPTIGAMLKRDLADDGLHPNAAGYKIMAPLARRRLKRHSGIRNLESSFFPNTSYNVKVRFPTALAFGHTQAEVARDDFFLVPFAWS